MRIIKPEMELITDVSEKDVLEIIERAGRVCYKSENKIEDGSAEKFVKMILGRGS